MLTAAERRYKLDSDNKVVPRARACVRVCVCGEGGDVVREPACSVSVCVCVLVCV